MHKNAIVSLVIILGILIAIPLISYLSFNKTTSGPKASLEQELKNIPSATGSLDLVQRPSAKNMIDIIYHNSATGEKVLGFSIDLLITPPGVSANTSTLAPGPLFTAANFLTPLKKVATTRSGTLFSFAAIRSNPEAHTSLQDGSILATLTLNNAKSGNYQLSIDNTTTSVLNESNTSLTKPFLDTITIAL